jgi:transposase
MKVVLGIDIAKLSFEAALLIDKKFYCKKFGNSHTGFKKLAAWLHSKNITSAHACMEATGKYGLMLAEWLSDHGFVVSMANPASIKGFAQSQLTRNKTDTADAKLIAKFTQALNPGQWCPPPPEIRELRDLVARCENLKNMIVQETNRLEMQKNSQVSSHIEMHVAWLKNELLELEKSIQQRINKDPSLRVKNELLQSIPGIGEKTSATVLAYVAFERFQSAKEVASYIGVNPRQHSSGTSIRGRTRLSKTGNAYLRKSLFMPSMAAIRFNGTIRRFAQQLTDKGKSKMVIIGAVMRKLVHIMYGVLKTGQPFDSAYRTTERIAKCCC